MKLSPSQLRYLSLHSNEGLTFKEIAHIVKACESTINNQLMRARKENDCKNNPQLALKAYKAGIL
jgi:DNA-binding CsgD family transcriptional regulator